MEAGALTASSIREFAVENQRAPDRRSGALQQVLAS